jgi:hypothetical protein
MDYASYFNHPQTLKTVAHQVMHILADARYGRNTAIVVFFLILYAQTFLGSIRKGGGANEFCNEKVLPPHWVKPNGRYWLMVIGYSS